jgi:hypothetical protein
MCLDISYYSGDQIEKNEMYWACRTYRGRGVVHTGFWWGHLRERHLLEDPGLDGRIILRWISRKWKGEGGIDCIDLAQVRRRWRALLTMVMNLRSSIKCGEVLTIWEPVSFSRRTLLHGVWNMHMCQPQSSVRYTNKTGRRNCKNNRATEGILQQVFIVPIKYFYICLAIFLHEYTTGGP